MPKKGWSSKKAVLFFLTCPLIVLAGLSFLPVKYSLTIEMANPPRNEVLQVFYDIGNGFNENDSTSVLARSVQDATIFFIRVSLPALKIKGIRIDPGARAGSWNIKSIALESRIAGFVLGSHTWLSDDIARDFVPLHAIDAFSARDGMLFLNAKADDPYFAYNGDFRKVQQPSRRMARHFKITIWITTAFLAFFSVLLYWRATPFVLKNLFLSIKRLPGAAIEILIKPFSSMRQQIMAVSCICALFFVALVACKDFREANGLRFAVDLETSVSGVSQVFYNEGGGYNEADSWSIVVQSGNSQRYTFPLSSSKAIQSIRFDPINVSAVVRIKNARIENSQGDIVKKFQPQDFRPIQQIKKMDIRNGALIFHIVKNANDPIAYIENSSIENQFP